MAAGSGLFARLAAGGAIAAAMAGCAGLPSQEGRLASYALPPATATRLGQAVEPLVSAHPGMTGIHALPLAPDAFAARVLLAAAAQRSLDVQYYIWRGDQTGLLLFEALAQAADRGVRVRILIDDQNTGPIEEVLAALAARSNLEVRIYNPFATRSARVLDYVGDFSRLNRRMHNKAYVADNQVALVGGRNIGNEYFGAGEEVPFKDLDVIAIGPAVGEVSAEFDRYWNSASAYPAQRLLGPPAGDAAARLEATFAGVRADPDAQSYLAAVRETPLVVNLLERRLELEWAHARLVADDPAKTLDRGERTEVLMLAKLLSGGERPGASLDIISPYFAPAQKGSAVLESLARDGVRVRVLTNSFAATDVAVVHSGYAKRRCDLARAGVRLYEMKRTVEGGPRQPGGTKGSSNASLHAKTFAADESRIFVGSFNFDPRSALLNTEMGLVISSPALATRLARAFEAVIPRNAYEVVARPQGGCIQWLERTASGEVRYDAEPETGWLKRAWLEFLGWLPLDWML
jgi:putative cardiolipin synthase